MTINQQIQIIYFNYTKLNSNSANKLKTLWNLAYKKELKYVNGQWYASKLNVDYKKEFWYK
jgi:hypothetical protein